MKGDPLGQPMRDASSVEPLNLTVPADLAVSAALVSSAARDKVEANSEIACSTKDQNVASAASADANAARQST